MKTPPGMFRWDALRRNLRALTPLDHEATREEERMLHTVLDPHGWDEATTTRGLAGLKLSASGEWDMGWMFVFRLGHRLDFAAVEDRAGHLSVAMGLLRPRQMLSDPPVRGHDPETLAVLTTGMTAVHRVWEGSVLCVGMADRADRVIVWVGLHDRLSRVAGAEDAMAKLHAAAEAEREEERKAAKAVRQPTRAEIEQSRAQQAAMYEEFVRAQAAEKAAEPSSPASAPAPRVSVCDQVRDLVHGAHGGLTAKEIETKSGHSQSRIYRCLTDAVNSGEMTKVGKKYVTTPKIEEEEN